MVKAHWSCIGLFVFFFRFIASEVQFISAFALHSLLSEIASYRKPKATPLSIAVHGCDFQGVSRSDGVAILVRTCAWTQKRTHAPEWSSINYQGEQREPTYQNSIVICAHLIGVHRGVDVLFLSCVL
eukprot:5867677-Amphidinium_carterae.1